MPHIISYTEEIEEHGYCQQRPELTTGEKYLHEVDGQKRLRIVKSVHLVKYVWENVVQWSIDIEEYLSNEYTLKEIPIKVDTNRWSKLPVFIANGMIGVLTCNKDMVPSELVIPSEIGNLDVRGIAPFGFFECKGLTKVTFSPMVVIVYPFAFAHSNLKEIVFNDEVPVYVHTTALDHCDKMPKFDKMFDRPFSGKYMICSEKMFENNEKELRRLHFIS